MVLAGTWVSLSPCARIWAWIAFFADCRANTITAWRCRSILSAACFGDRLRAAITTDPFVMNVVVRAQPRSFTVVVGPAFILRTKFYQIGATTHINSHNAAQRCLMFICCLFDCCAALRELFGNRLRPGGTPKIAWLRPANMCSQIFYKIPRPANFF
jgi:hypothetical protein